MPGLFGNMGVSPDQQKQPDGMPGLFGGLK